LSYLYKRDEWETRKELNGLLEKLRNLCREGLPLQNRISIWSELGRSVYFVYLTENTHKKQRGLRFYQQQVNAPDNQEPQDNVDTFSEKCKRVYEGLKRETYEDYLHLYQELEDDILYLRETIGKDKLPYEPNIRNICRTFITWCKIFSDPSTEDRIKYFTTYSRSVLRICYGIIVSQTCNYLESQVNVEEDQAFWLLISITNYLMSSYFENSENPLSVESNDHRKKITLPNSALRCRGLGAVKVDLLLLKILLKEKEIQVFNKFDELGLPLEYYFADHLTSLFINLFNPGLTFRIWDNLFFEGSSTTQTKANRLLVSVIFVLLRECKEMIIEAKKSADIKYIIEVYAKFQTSHNYFINEVYKFIQATFEQALPSNASVLDRLQYIRYALFTDQYNRFDKKIGEIQNQIMTHHQDVFDRNIAMFGLANTPSKKRDDGNVLPYPALVKMIKDFHSKYGARMGTRVAYRKDDEGYTKSEMNAFSPQR